MIFEKKFAVIRIISVLLEVTFGFIQPGIFSTFLSQNNFGFLLILYGCAIYFVFMDGGFSRILYAEIRQLYVEQKEYNPKITIALKFYSTVGLLIFILFSTFSAILFYLYSNTFQFVVIVLLSLGISINILLSYIKSVFSAIDKYEQYERIDIVRKILNIMAIGLVILDKSFFLTSVFTVIFSTGLLCYSYYILSGKFFTRNLVFNLTSLQLFKQTFSTSKNIIAFSLAEALIYNVGFLVIPIIYNSYQVVQFGLWMKIIMGMAVFIRLATDINIHQITKQYFGKLKKETYSSFIKTLLVSIFVMVIIFLSFFFLKEFFFKIWVKNKYQLDNYFVFALLLILIGNSIQHIAGTFLLSTGKNFPFLRKTSLLLLMINVLVYFIAYFIKPDIGLFLIFVQIIYLFGSILYFKRALFEINRIE